MLKESDILFEIGDYWVHWDKKLECYLIMQNGITHSHDVARTYLKGEEGLKKAIRITKARYDSENKVYE